MNIKVGHKKYLVNSYPFRGKVFGKGKGNYLYDREGSKYLDMMTNYGVNIFGYDNPRLTAAFVEQIKILPTLHGSFANEVRTNAARDLLKRSGGKLKQIYFSNSGTEAIEAAVKFAVLATGRKKLISTEGGFHGKTLGALVFTHNEKYKKGLEDVIVDAEFVEYGDTEVLEEALDGDTACFVLEPIQGESGIILPPKDYLKEVENICKEKGVLLILDEIQTGTGRTGRFLTSHWEDIEPDIVCLGKGLAGGIPVGATLVSKEVGENIPKAFHTSTFGGNPLAARGIITVLELLTDEKLEEIRELGRYFLSELSKLDADWVKEVRGAGLMLGVEVEDAIRNKILKGLQQNHILACPAADGVVRFLPPYTVNKQEIDKTVENLAKIVN